MLEVYDLTAGERMCVSTKLQVANEAVRQLSRREAPALIATSDLCNSPVADLPTAKSPALRFHGCLHGYEVHFDGAETVVFPTWDAGAAAVKAAREAQAQLVACLANPSMKRRA